MICVRQLATAFLLNEGDLLIMRRSPGAVLLPGMYAPVGGHLEPGELRDPRAAFEREVFEETGLSPADLADVNLRYIVHRLRDDEVRIQYVFFARALKRHVTPSAEGELQWVPLQNARNLDVSATTRFILDHYIELGARTREIYVGTVRGEGGSPRIEWALLSDWE